jgi:hypothetical protein
MMKYGTIGLSSATWRQALDEQSLEVTVLSLDGTALFNTYAGLSSGIANDNSIVMSHLTLL